MDLASQADAFFRRLQTTICDALEREDGRARFHTDKWERPGGGGGITRVIADGAVFEKGGVNTSSVHGELKADFAAQLPGDGLKFFAAGISLVIHPRSPMVPTVHANFRCLQRGSALWFGGGADLTPYYPAREDVLHFHSTWKRVCDAHDPSYYPRFKKWCDEYFYLPHRGETRGVGGLFFDHLGQAPRHSLGAADSPPSGRLADHLQGDVFDFVRDAGEAFVEAYLPIVKRRRQDAFGERERQFQLLRRGRYVEFNLLYDRGTTFGLKTDGRVESILMSLPPLVRWEYDPHFPEGSREADLQNWLRPRDWLGE